MSVIRVWRGAVPTTGAGLLLEDASGVLLLEDGTNFLELE